MLGFLQQRRFQSHCFVRCRFLKNKKLEVMSLLLQSFLTNPQILIKPKAITATPDFTNRELAVEASCKQ